MKRKKKNKKKLKKFVTKKIYDVLILHVNYLIIPSISEIYKKNSLKIRIVTRN